MTQTLKRGTIRTFCLSVCLSVCLCVDRLSVTLTRCVKVAELLSSLTLPLSPAKYRSNITFIWSDKQRVRYEKFSIFNQYLAKSLQLQQNWDLDVCEYYGTLLLS